MAKRREHRKLTKAEIDASVEISRYDAYVRIAQAVAPALGWLFIGFFGYLSIHDLAGKITIANISVLAKAITGTEGSVMALCWFVVFLAVFFGIAGLFLARRERKLRKDTIERLHPYQKMWEASIDPSRTSSNLTPRGDTRPEDK